jgi:cytochrome b involved in lipid metabolism
MLDVGGQDATEAFEDVGHSDEAREILDGLLVGTLKRQVSDFVYPRRTHRSYRIRAGHWWSHEKPDPKN